MLTAWGPNPIVSWCLLSWEIQFCLLLSLMCSLHLLLVHRDLWFHTRYVSVQPFANQMDHVALQLPSCCVMLYATTRSSSASMATLHSILYSLVHGNIIGAARFHPNSSDDILATWSLSPGLKAMNHVHIVPCYKKFAVLQQCSTSAAIHLWHYRQCPCEHTGLIVTIVTNPAGLVNTHLTTHMPDYQVKHFGPVGCFFSYI